MYKSEDYDWTNIYGDVQKELPKNMPKAKGRKVKLTMFAESLSWQVDRQVCDWIDPYDKQNPYWLV